MNMLEVILNQLPYIIQKVDDTTWQVLSRHRRPLFVNKLFNTKSDDPTNSMLRFHKKPTQKQLMKIVDNDSYFVEKENDEIVRVYLYTSDTDFTGIDHYKTEEYAEKKGALWVKYQRKMIELTYLLEELKPRR